MMEDIQQSTTQDGFYAELFENVSNGGESRNICAAEDGGVIRDVWVWQRLISQEIYRGEPAA